jgi:hypothetical protein
MMLSWLYWVRIKHLMEIVSSFFFSFSFLGCGYQEVLKCLVHICASQDVSTRQHGSSQTSVWRAIPSLESNFHHSNVNMRKGRETPHPADSAHGTLLT